MLQEMPWYRFVSELWEVWVFLLFVGIILWAYWPGNRAKWERAGRIPLEEDDGDGR